MPGLSEPGAPSGVTRTFGFASMALARGWWEVAQLVGRDEQKAQRPGEWWFWPGLVSRL